MRRSARRTPTGEKLVTALRERPRGRVEIELDGLPWRVVPADAVVRAGVRSGAGLDRVTARALGRELRRSRALARAARALGQRERSSAALRDRLEAAGTPPRATAEALGTLERLGLVDDVAVAARRAEALAARGWGDAGILARLEHEGFPREPAAAALAGLEPEAARARALLGAAAGPKELRRLAARGFDAGTLADVSGFAEEGWPR